MYSGESTVSQFLVVTDNLLPHYSISSKAYTKEMEPVLARSRFKSIHTRAIKTIYEP